MSLQAALHTKQVFSKLSTIPDLLKSDASIISLYKDEDHVLHMQCTLRESGMLVLFPITFRLVNKYLSGALTLREVIEQSPCERLLLVTRGHNLLELESQAFDYSQLSFASKRYPAIKLCKIAPVEEIRRNLHACMRG